MKRRHLIGLCTLLWLSTPWCVNAQVSAADELDTLETLVSEWIELRRQIGEEQEAFLAKQRHIEREMDLLTREKASLQEASSRVSKALETLTASRTSLESDTASLATTTKSLGDFVTSAETDVLRWRTLIPASLATQGSDRTLHSILNAIPVEPAERELQPLTTRITNVLAAYGAIEALQQTVSVCAETIRTASDRRAVDVLYLGLARGFAVAPDDRWAAIGEPSATGWRWTDRSELAKTIRRAIDTASSPDTSELIDLPISTLQIESAEQRP